MRNAIIAVGATMLLGCTIDNGSTEPGTPVTITWAPCINDIGAPGWMAVKDGDGAWTRIVQTNGVYTFTVRSGRVGMATYNGSSSTLTINYTTTAEADSSKPNCAGALRNVTGTITGFSTLDDINIQPGQAFVPGTSAQPASFTLTDVTPSAFDVLTVRSRDNVSGSVLIRAPSAVFIRRAQTSSSLAAIDLNGSESGAPQSKTLTVQNTAAGEDMSINTSLNTMNGAIDMSQYSTTVGAGGGAVTATFYGLPATRLTTGEVQTIDVANSISVNSTTTNFRFATLTFTDIADKTVTLGPILGAVSVGTSARPSLTYSIQAGYDQTFDVLYQQGSGVATRNIDMAATRGYIGASATSVTLAIPDLSGLSGFQTSWLLSVGATAHYSFVAEGATYSITQRNNQNYTAAARVSTFIP
jgi:hypothetical protein